MALTMAALAAGGVAALALAARLLDAALALAALGRRARRLVRARRDAAGCRVPDPSA
jgi:hypothetical protein